MVVSDRGCNDEPNRIVYLRVVRVSRSILVLPTTLPDISSHEIPGVTRGWWFSGLG